MIAEAERMGISEPTCGLLTGTSAAGSPSRNGTPAHARTGFPVWRLSPLNDERRPIRALATLESVAGWRFRRSARYVMRETRGQT